MNRRDLIGNALAMASATVASSANGEPAGKGGTTYSSQLDFTVRIAMRDGVHLSGRLYLPRESKLPRPAICSLTPYIADNYHAEGLDLSHHGYPYLAVDIRSRGDSEGVFNPFFADPADCQDIVEWIAKQPWCNGKIGMRGLSYVGYTQWAAVRGAPSHLMTIVPSSPCWVGFDYPMRYNIFLSFVVTWVARVNGRSDGGKIYNDAAFWQQEHLRFLESGLPFKKMDAFFGLTSKPFQEWINHPHQSDYWDRANPTPEQLSNLTIPVLTLCGGAASDGDQPGAIQFYREHVKHAGAKATHYLVIGPWGHIEVRTPKAEFNGIKVGPAAVVDMNQLHRDWYAHTLEGGPLPAFLKDKVNYYVMVADTWRHAASLDAVTARHETLYLRSSNNPSNVFNAGTLATTPAKTSEPDHYVYDPRDLSVPKLEATLTQSSMVDQTLIVSDVGGKLIYHSAPFDADTEVSGYFKFTAWLGIDAPDTDFLVTIYDIGVDGSSMFITEQHQRARHREDLRTEKLIDTRLPLCYTFDRFFFVARIIKAGHRLRLVIRPQQSAIWQKNYNSGKAVADETMADARAVTVKLYHDTAHPSALHVPIARSET